MLKKLPSAGVPEQPTSQLVTQEQLRHYLELKAQLEQAEKKVAALRQDLLGKLEAGVPVQGGALVAQVRVVNQRLLTGEKLVPLLGREKIEELKAQVVPTVQRQLTVQPRPAVAHKPVAGTGPGWDGEFEG